MATAPTANDLTRQQLDELDALLQRMLSLPLPVPEKATGSVPTLAGTIPLPDPVVPATVKNWRVDQATPAPTTTPHLLIAPSLPDPIVPSPRRAPEPPIAPEPVRPLIPEIPRQAITPPPPPLIQQPLAAPVSHLPFAEPEPEPLSPEPVHRSTSQPLRPIQSQPSQPYTPSPYADVPALLWPLAAVNRVADAVLGLFGPPGKLLRSGFGKNLLGIVGVGLLLYTSVHVAQLRGWLLMPLPLPWPR